MERIVLGISAINFNNTNELFSEKSAILSVGSFPAEPSPYTMATADPCESITEADTSDQPIHNASTILPTRRSLPSRLAKCKENSLLRIKRRSIMKPKKDLSSSMNDVTMRPANIRKLYLENKIKGNFRPSNLETIYEEPTPDKNQQMCFIGAKKIRRSLSCSDGLNVTKSTVKSRRLKVRKTFGRRFSLKKISLEEFIDRLNASFDETTNERHIESAIPTEQPEAKTDTEEAAECEMECADDTLPLT